jgi:hypothetical protein
MGVFDNMSLSEIDAFWKDRMEKIEQARKAIVDKHTPLPEMGAVGHIDCPICTRGRLHYVISAHNPTAHVRDRSEAEGT